MVALLNGSPTKLSLENGMAETFTTRRALPALVFSASHRLLFSVTDQNVQYKV